MRYVRHISKAAYLAVAAAAFIVGRVTAKPAAERIEIVKWKTRRAHTVADVQTKTVTKVVTRWLRPNGTPIKTQTATSGTQRGEVARMDTLTTVGERSHVKAQIRAPRFNLGVMATPRRELGGYLNYRLTGPLTVGAWAFPVQRRWGVSLGVTF